jgi:hypothetical protein
MPVYEFTCEVEVTKVGTVQVEASSLSEAWDKVTYDCTVDDSVVTETFVDSPGLGPFRFFNPRIKLPEDTPLGDHALNPWSLQADMDEIWALWWQYSDGLAP